MDLITSFDPGKITEILPPFLKSLTPTALEILGHIYGIIVVVAIPVSTALVFGIFYSVFGINAISKRESEKLSAFVVPAYTEEKGDPELADRWKNILVLVNSENQNDWARAIMEADILLEEILDKSGYRGVGVAEKLKRVDKGDMENLDSAWEAHKIRNNIAHEPNFTLNKHEANRIIELYRKVFAEYYVI